MDAIALARLQFALTASFHFIFPSITIGLGLIVASLEVARWRTGNDVWDRAARFWTKIFALTFVVGVATGIVMEFQFGTNWARYSVFVGDIFGSPLAAEAILAFFLESTFLGLLLFGRDRISSGLRATAAGIVAFGAAMSGFWIIVANSWMQTPAGYEIQGDKAVLTDFFAALTNPSVLPRFTHTIFSSWALAGFIVMAVSAWYVRKGRAGDVSRLTLRVGLIVAIIGTLAVLGTGDMSSRQVAETQPAKFAAMQGLYSTTSAAPLVIWSLPPAQDPGSAVEGPAIQITHLLSFLTFGSFQAAITGLDAFPPADWPPVAATFLTYHNMVLLGTLMALVLLSGAYLWWRRNLERSPRWLTVTTWAFVLPFLAIQLGWATAEIGRQPWIVYGLMRTSDGTSTVVSAPDIVFSILLFTTIYVLLASLWLFLVRREVVRGPEEVPIADESPRAVLIDSPRPVEVH
jgi:cytochrome d ubiquinol oxidase subunit I